MPTALITGASRGIGREFVKQYAADGWRVHAACRNPDGAAELAAMATASDAIVVHRLDVTDAESVRRFANALRGETIDVLINNAGIYGPRDRGSLGKIDYDAWRQVLETNVLGATRVAEACAGLLRRDGGAVLATLSSRMGSVGENAGGGSYMYRTSKAAVNMVVKNLSIDLGPRGVIAIAFHPGVVRTDMGGAAAPVSPADSVAGMRQVIAGLRADNNGRFFDYDGSPIAW